MAKPVTKLCVICGEDFTVYASNAHRYSACPKPSCRTANRARRAPMGKAASMSPESQERRRASFRAKRIPAECGCGCGTAFLVTRAQLRARKNGRVFVDRSHYEAWFRGANVTRFWRGGERDRERYYGSNWKAQRKAALERDGYECRSCRSDRGLVVHHVRLIQLYRTPEAANVIGNLMTLCRSCHVQAHARGMAISEAPR